MMIRKTGGVSTLAVIDGVRAALSDIRKVLPPDITIRNLEPYGQDATRWSGASSLTEYIYRLIDPSLSRPEVAFLTALMPVFTDLSEAAEDSVYIDGTSRLLALDPGYGVKVLLGHGVTGLVTLGAVLLAVTRAEAL